MPKEVRFVSFYQEESQQSWEAELSTPPGGQWTADSDSLDGLLTGVEPAMLRVIPDSVLRNTGPSRTYDLQEVVVTASRIPQTASFSPYSISVLSRDDVRSSNATSLAQVLSPVSGVFIKDYGATSGLKTISQRGLGSEHTLILLNGSRISSFQNGLVDLGLVPVDEIESVEIVRGGQSASYGADAVAGLINVITKPVSSQNTVSAMTSVGSFGYKRYHVSGSVASGLDGIRVSYGEERSDEDFTFRFHNGPLSSTLDRRNADLIARYANAFGGLQMG
ncbi:MAG: TonB-dependent receptor plug domain-containing protein, partial [Bacteroidota bacterium]